MFIILATSSAEGTHHIYVHLAQVTRHSPPCTPAHGSATWKSQLQVSETQMLLDIGLQTLLQGISKSS